MNVLLLLAYRIKLSTAYGPFVSYPLDCGDGVVVGFDSADDSTLESLPPMLCEKEDRESRGFVDENTRQLGTAVTMVHATGSEKQLLMHFTYSTVAKRV